MRSLLVLALVALGCSTNDEAPVASTGGTGGTTGGAGGTTGGAGGSAGSTGGAAGASAKTGTLIPLYTSPTDSTWSTAIAAKKAHPSVPMIAVVNPSSGPGGSKDASYDTGCQQLKDVGIVVLGYVATGYGANDPTTVVKPNIDKYVAWYPAVTGIFFDEQSNEAGKEGYYQDLDAYAKSQGLAFTVGNPGTDTAQSYVGVLDMMLIYESKGVPTLAEIGGWHSQYARDNFGIIPYGVASLDAAYVASAKPYVGWIYITDDDLPNPWDSLPPYFAELVAELDQ